MTRWRAIMSGGNVNGDRVSSNTNKTTFSAEKLPALNLLESVSFDQTLDQEEVSQTKSLTGYEMSTLNRQPVPLGAAFFYKYLKN